MSVQWTECPRGDVMPHWSKLYVTMNREGFIVLNKIAYRKLGEPEAFQLLFDKMNNRIGLKPATPQTRNAYPATKYGQHGGKLIRAFRLMTEFGIEISETVQFHDAEIDDEGIMILDLRTARVSARAKPRRVRAS